MVGDQTIGLGSIIRHLGHLILPQLYIFLINILHEMEAVLPFDSNPHMTNENGTLEST